MKKIGIVSFANYPDEFVNNINKRRMEALNEISEYANEKKITHILFPGATLFYKTRDEKLAKKHLNQLKRIFHNQSIIAELDCEIKPNTEPFGVYAIQKGKIVKKPICQLFVKSHDNKNLYEKLWKETFELKNRIIILDGIKFLIWVCGEINILKNIQSQNNIVRGFRYTFDKINSIKKLKFDVFFNPTHGMLTNLYNKYKERLKFMSRYNRYAIICLNVLSHQVQRSGSILVFKNKKEILHKNNKIKWSGEKWVIEIIEYK